MVSIPRGSRRIRKRTHWYANYKSQSDTILNVDAPVSGGEEVDFWTWYFIEQDFDYGFVEALVNGDWVTVEVKDDNGATVTTDTNPFGNNTEGNGLTGTSGGVVLRRRARPTSTSRLSCRRARPTSASATRQTRRTSTPAGSWTT